MFSNNEIQETIVTRLKANAPVVASLTTPDEVREESWQGILFVYPCIRVQLGVQLPLNQDCSLVRIPVTILCYSEEASSYQANAIAMLVNDSLHRHTFSGNTVSIIGSMSNGLVDAIRIDQRTWRSEARFTMLVQAKL